VASAKTLRAALGGRCEQRPVLVQQAIPPSALVTQLGYRIAVEALLL